MIQFDALNQYELSLLLALNGDGSLYLDGVMWVVTKTSTWFPLFLALFYVLLKNLGWKHSLMTLVLVSLLILVADQVPSGFCKPFFARLRPTHEPFIGELINVVNGYRGGKYSFFSSHASNTFAAATFFALMFRYRLMGVILFLWASLCSYSRLYLGVHYPSDILVGMLFGSFSGFCFYQFWKVLSSYLFHWVAFRHTPAFTSTGFCPGYFRVVFMAFSISCIYVIISAFWYAAFF